MPLTVETIQNAKPGITPNGRETRKPYKLYDSGGLYLEVSPRGGKWWRWKYRFQGKEKRLSLGVFPKVSLLEARSKRDAFRALLKEDKDPSNHNKAERVVRREEQMVKREMKGWLFTATRFTLNGDGALSFRIGKRRLNLTPAETAELHCFLNATRNKSKVISCL